MTDYRAAITSKFPAPRAENIQRWLDENESGWRDQELDLAADAILRHVLSAQQYGTLTVDEAEDAEGFIIKQYLEEAV